MSFQGCFIVVVVLFVVAPKQVVALAGYLIDQLMPIAHKGLVLTVMVAGILIIAGRFRL